MKKITFSLLFLQISCLVLTAQVSVINLLTENRYDPMGLDFPQPRFTWQLVSGKRNVVQSAYEIKVMTGKTIVWSSGKIVSAQSVHVSYAGSPLHSGKKYTWQVKVWDNYGKNSAWSKPAFFQMGFLNSADWKARWIEPGYSEDQALRPSPLMRKQFTITRKITSATAYITAHGLYEAQINGQRIGDAYLTPGWTSYKERLQYQVYDVTALLNAGNNVVGVMLGNGWYRGIIGYTNNIDVYGKQVSLLCQLEITYADGTIDLVLSDSTWKSSTGAVRYSEIYNGEIVDAQLEKTGWTLPDMMIPIGIMSGLLHIHG